MVLYDMKKVSNEGLGRKSRFLFCFCRRVGDMSHIELVFDDSSDESKLINNKNASHLEAMVSNLMTQIIADKIIK